MADEANMTVPGIQGSCDIQGREGTIRVQYVEHNVSRPYDIDTGQPTGRRVHSPFVIRKEVDKASPLLYRDLAEGKKYDSVELKWYRTAKDGNQEHYFTTKLTDALLVSIKALKKDTQDLSSKSYKDMEDVSFVYRRIDWKEETNGVEAYDDWRKA
ncbi:MAG: type VI secretion system tube protein Hcp [Acidobacteriaceae bacterium]|nr:type VI secretion system tube protein Hcp [Acidobacteriaceae bacterium]MBV9296408.1 type VI secretion system tube protein Hcp [Acidobacteriaceae bacterium]MBV9764380.1 type VI secretion system tube protein Hcp [Acidobacteriaceae bacterium]